MLFDYLKNRYGKNEPIFLSDLKIETMKANTIRQQMKILTDKNIIKRYDDGIYYIPQESVFKTGSQLSFDKVVQKKYLINENKERCGYISGLYFANAIGITTQVPAVYEIITNKATKDYRSTSIAEFELIIKKPRIMISNENYYILQFLDLIKDIELYSSLSNIYTRSRLVKYLEKNKIDFSEIEKYLKFYPDKVYKNLYELGLLEWHIYTEIARC